MWLEWLTRTFARPSPSAPPAIDERPRTSRMTSRVERLEDRTMLSAANFTAPVLLDKTDDTPVALLVSDLNDDGDADIAAVGDGTISTFVSGGQGGFTTGAGQNITGQTFFAADTADFDGDGQADLAAALFDVEVSRVDILLSDGLGGFVQAGGSTFYIQPPSQLAVGDVNGDQDIDVVVVTDDALFIQGLGIYYGDGDGNLDKQEEISTGGGGAARDLKLADVDGSGALDVLVLDDANDAVYVLLNDGTGTFSTPIGYSTGGSNPVSLFVGDVDGDTNLDLVIGDAGTTPVVLFGDGTGAFGTPTPAASFTGSPYALGEFTGDGLLDLIGPGGDGTSFQVYAGDGAGNFVTDNIDFAIGLTPVGIATVGALNGDGKADLVFVDTMQVAVVLGANQPPEITIDPPGEGYVTDENVPLVLEGISISDPDAGTGELTLKFTTTDGLFTVNDAVTNGVTAANITGNATSEVSLTGTLEQINTTLAASDGLQYLSQTETFGFATDTIEVSVDDNGNTGSQGQLETVASDSFTVGILAQNDPPINTVPNGPLTTVTTTPLIITGLAVDDRDLNLLAEGDANLAVTLSAGFGTITIDDSVEDGVTSDDITDNGTSTVTIFGTLDEINTTLGSAQGVTYVANLEFIGTDTFTMTSDDLGQTGGGSSLVIMMNTLEMEKDTDTDSFDIQVLEETPNQRPINSLPLLPIIAAVQVQRPIFGLGVTDPDNKGTDFTVTLSVTAGTLTLRDNVLNGLEAGDITGNGTGTVVLEGTEEAVNNTLSALGGVIYLATDTLAETDELTINTNDNGTDEPGGAMQDTDIVPITLTRGIVLASTQDGKLTITGDASANMILLTRLADGQFLIAAPGSTLLPASDDLTLLKVSTQSILISGLGAVTDDVRILAGDGDDMVSILDPVQFYERLGIAVSPPTGAPLPDDLLIDSGPGNDQVEINGLNVIDAALFNFDSTNDFLFVNAAIGGDFALYGVVPAELDIANAVIGGRFFFNGQPVDNLRIGTFAAEADESIIPDASSLRMFDATLDSADDDDSGIVPPDEVLTTTFSPEEDEEDGEIVTLGSPAAPVLSHRANAEPVENPPAENVAPSDDDTGSADDSSSGIELTDDELFAGSRLWAGDEMQNETADSTDDGFVQDDFAQMIAEPSEAEEPADPSARVSDSTDVEDLPFDPDATEENAGEESETEPETDLPTLLDTPDDADAA